MTDELHDRQAWLTPAQQVERLADQGVRFDLISKADAETYLARNNNYFRIRSYKKNFAKVEEGRRKGQYANLDFKMLIDLSIVDMLLRNELLPMTLDIEHFAKVRLLERIEQEQEDGYAIVAEFIASYDDAETDKNSILAEIKKGASSPYISEIIDDHPDGDYPVWRFFEVISFGTFVFFYKFCAERFGDKALKNDFYILQSVKCMRNACAHNSCVLKSMTSGSARFKTSYEVSQALGSIASLNQGQRKSKLDNDAFQGIATTFYMHQRIASEGVCLHRARRLEEFRDRMNAHADYYVGNDQIASGFDFIDKLIDAWYSWRISEEDGAADKL